MYASALHSLSIVPDAVVYASDGLGVEAAAVPEPCLLQAHMCLLRPLIGGWLLGLITVP